MKRETKRVWTMMLILALLGSLWSVAAGAQTGELDIQLSGSPIPDDNGIYTLNDPGLYTVSMKTVEPSTTNQIAIATSGASLTMNNITMGGGNGNSIYSNSASTSYPLTIKLEGQNTVGSIASGISPLTIEGGGTLNATSIEAQNVTITGGSINAKFPGTSIKNDKDTDVYLTIICLEGTSEGVVVADAKRTIPQNERFDFKGAQTDGEGKLYFYLPEGTTITEIMTEGDSRYTGNAETVVPTDVNPAKTNIFTLYTPAPPAPVYPFAVTQTSAEGGYTNDESGLTITKAGSYTVSMSTAGATANVPITVKAPGPGRVDLTLYGVSVDTSRSERSALLMSEVSTDLRLIMAKGTVNTFISGGTCAGIAKEAMDENLIITSEDETGKLIAKGGSGGAGVGGSMGKDAKYISIEGGTVVATGGLRGAGIGGGSGGEASFISVEGGAVTADGSTGAAGIGGGYKGAAANIIITGGKITASTERANDAAAIGAGEDGECGAIAISGGTVIASGYIGDKLRTSGNTKITGGSVWGETPGVTGVVPVIITLSGEGTGIKAEDALIQYSGKKYDYGLNDVKTQSLEHGKLRFFLPAGASLQSVDASDGLASNTKTYTAKKDYTVPEAGGSVTLFPPHFKVLPLAAIIENTYRDGLILKPASDNVTVSLSKDITIADSPITIQPPDIPIPGTITLNNLKVDASDRGASLNVELDGRIPIALEGKNALAGVAFLYADDYALTTTLKTAAELTITDITFGLQTETVKGKSASVPLWRLPGMTLKNGANSGTGSFQIAREGGNYYDIAAANCAVAFEGLMPSVPGSLTLDKDSSLTVGESATLVILPGSQVTGEGKLIVRGSVVGSPETGIWYPIDASASGSRTVTLTGVTDGLAQAGALVTATAPEEAGFLGWDVTPAIAGLDLTKPTLSFTADRAYTLKAKYPTAVTGVSFDKAKADVEAGDTVYLKWTVAPADATERSVTFVSDHPEIASVDENGVVYGAAAGTATVTVTTAEGGFTATCEVTVTEGAVKPLDVEKAAIAPDKKLKLKAPAGYAGTWSTADANIAAIVKGKYVKGVSTGETTLTFTVTQVLAKNPGLVRGKALAVGESASVPLAVRKKKDLVKTVKLGAKTVYLAPGEELTVTPTLKPAGAPDKNVLYQSSDSRVFRAEGRKIIAMGLGKAKLTATASSFVQKKLTVIVTDRLQKLIPAAKKLKIAVNGSARANVSPQPLGLNAAITYTSKNEKVARVTPEGTIFGIAKGKTKITAACEGKKAVIEVTVK